MQSTNNRTPIDNHTNRARVCPVAKPFVKWAGGKTQLIPQLSEHVPFQPSGVIDVYCEPFLGGGALFFWLSSRYTINHAYLFELNKQLVYCYQAIKSSVNALITQLEKIEKKYLSLTDKKREGFFYTIREDYNELIKSKSSDKVKIATLYIFLNKTCFNGLYRVNSNNLFNVPHGRYNNPTICDEENLMAVNKILKRATIKYADFSNCIKYAKKGAFVYLDPPYRPLTTTSSFTNYVGSGFNDEDQKRVHEVYNKLNEMEAYVLLSNSDSAKSSTSKSFFDKLFNKYQIKRLIAKRMINSNGSKRGNITEILVKNF